MVSLSPVHRDALVVAVDDDYFEQIMQILLAKNGLQLDERSELPRDDRADRAGHIRILNQAAA